MGESISTVVRGNGDTRLAEAPALKNVLMITYVFPPNAGAGVQRTLKFSKYLPALGWHPTIVTIRPYGWKGMDDSLVKEVPPDIDVQRCYSLELRRLPTCMQPLLMYHYVMKFRRLFHVPDHCIGWLPFALAAVRKIVKNGKVDIVYSSFPPGTALLIGYIVKKQYGIPWVADFRDPWTHHPWFEARTSRIYRPLTHSLEKRFLSYADKIIVTANTLKYDFLKRYPHLSADNIHTITNGYDEEDFSGLKNEAPSSVFNIVYTGSIGSLQLQHFGRAVKRLINNGAIDRQDLQITLVGNGEGPLMTPDPKVDLDGLPYTMTGYVSHQQSIEYLHKASVLLLYSWGKNVIPGKTFEYLRARIPILALAKENDELAEFIRKSGAGIVVPPDEENLIAKALFDLFIKKREIGQKLVASNEFIAQYERRILTSKLTSIFDKLVS